MCGCQLTDTNSRVLSPHTEYYSELFQMSFLPLEQSPPWEQQLPARLRKDEFWGQCANERGKASVFRK